MEKGRGRERERGGRRRREGEQEGSYRNEKGEKMCKGGEGGWQGHKESERVIKDRID